jgi:hypothetical protein
MDRQVSPSFCPAIALAAGFEVDSVLFLYYTGSMVRASVTEESAGDGWVTNVHDELGCDCPAALCWL